MTATTPCPIARAEAGLAAIFAACQANKARDAQARQAKADARLAQGGLWWRKDNSPTQHND
jgi:hypothetical protein